MAEKAGLGTHVFFRPWTPLVSDIYTASDLVLMPSRFEGVPLVMLEALMAGRPVAAAGVDGMRDYLPPEWLVSPLTGQTMAHCAIQILNDPLLDQKICKARDFVLAQTSPELFKSTAIRLFVDLPRS
jgi:glycosyltransferase involved in cell wall biosynthesis